jgi:transcriptional regulator
VYGRGRIFDEPEALQAVVEALTQKYEAHFEQPWQPDYKASMLGAIVGVEVVITEIQCKYKLGQNRPVRDQLQVIEQLQRQGATVLAEAMARNTR